MTLKQQKIISTLLIAFVVFGGFEALIFILDLNQPVLYLQTALWIWLYLFLKIALIYDLHFKNPGSLKRAVKKHESVPHWLMRGLKVLWSALQDRFSHLLEPKFFVRWLNYLLLPGIIFWSSIGLFFVNHFGIGFKTQQIVALLSAVALLINYWYLKEIFIRDKEVVDRDIFICLSSVKIYASGIAYAAALALIRYDCLSSAYLFLGIFCVTFLLVYQALFQHHTVKPKNLRAAMFIALVISFLSHAVLVLWGLNYFTGAIFLTACYNFMWGTYHYKIDRSLNWHTFSEIVIVSLIVMAMIFSVTNFKAKLLDSCHYELWSLKF